MKYQSFWDIPISGHLISIHCSSAWVKGREDSDVVATSIYIYICTYAWYTREYVCIIMHLSSWGKLRITIASTSTSIVAQHISIAISSILNCFFRWYMVVLWKQIRQNGHPTFPEWTSGEHIQTSRKPSHCGWISSYIYIGPPFPSHGRMISYL